jgi:hypothetical protein
MPLAMRIALWGMLIVVSVGTARSQDLAPRAYIISPVRANAITVTWSNYRGSLNLNGAVPITDASGTYNVPVLSYSRTFGFFGRSASISGSVPYGFGNFEGELNGTQKEAYRSGLFDSTVRFAVNLKGGPAMNVKEFLKWKQTWLIGASVKVVIPTGQYDPTKVVNWGINRWAVKPEIGFSRRWSGRWILDAYAGAWFYTANSQAYAGPVPKEQSENPIGAFEGHLSYDFPKRGSWASLDGNFWFGGMTTLGGVQNPDTRQTSSRIGGTFAYPLTRHQSIKVAYSGGTYIRFGGAYRNLQVAWQYAWIDKAK